MFPTCSLSYYIKNGVCAGFVVIRCKNEKSVKERKKTILYSRTNKLWKIILCKKLACCTHNKKLKWPSCSNETNFDVLPCNSKQNKSNQKNMGNNHGLNQVSIVNEYLNKGKRRDTSVRNEDKNLNSKYF